MGLKENLLQEPISRLDLREPVVADVETTVRDGVLAMRERSLGCVIVVDSEQKPLGMFTEGMLRNLLVSNPEAVSGLLRDYMDCRRSWIAIKAPVAKVLREMQARHTRFLGVVDEDGRLVGLTGQKGLMEYVAEHFPGQVMVQRIGGASHMTDREGA